MKHTRIGILYQTCSAWLMVAAAPLVGAQTPAPATPPAATAPTAAAPAELSAAQISYLFGLTFGEQMHGIGIGDQVTTEDVARGIKDGLHGKKSQPEERQQIQMYVRNTMNAGSARNLAASKEFLARNGKEKGVITTASGLQYKIVAPGDAKAAPVVPTDTVTVQYRGKLLDGSEFDSTYSAGTPATFPVNGVIPAWQEALVLMKPGAKWQLFVPPELGYSASPKPGIPGNSLLLFDVELVSVKSTGEPAATAAQPSAKPAPKSK